MKKIFTAIMMILTFAFLMMLPISRAYAIKHVTLPQVGYHPGSINYWSTPYFANALSMGDGWLSQSSRPVFVSFEGKEDFFIRSGCSSQPLSREEQSAYEKEHLN